MGDGRSTCKRVQCQDKIDPEWAPWSSEYCWQVWSSLDKIPVASGGTSEATKNANVPYSFSWLDARHPDAKPVARPRR